MLFLGIHKAGYNLLLSKNMTAITGIFNIFAILEMRKPYILNPIISPPPLNQTERVPLQAGYREHPQNALPEFAPCLAMRFSIALWQIGHVGVFVVRVDVAEVALAGVDTPLISACNALPSISSMFRPVANARASSVNIPDVTTKPPVAPFAAITPYSSRTTDTPTL